MAKSTTISNLERMGGELKCPICLGLYKNAATLSCNHSFCTSCILESMKGIGCCPICKVPANRREVRSAPQMDSLVAIFKGLENSAGVNLFQTQQSQPQNFAGREQHGSPEVEVPKVPMSRGRKNKVQIHLENKKIGPPKKRRRGKSQSMLSNVTDRQEDNETGVAAMEKGHHSMPGEQSFQGLVPVNKRVRGPPPSVEHVGPRPSNQDEAQQHEVYWVSSDPHDPSSSFIIVDIGGVGDASPKVAENPQSENISRNDSRGKVPSSLVNDGNRSANESSIPPSNGLSPFFWLRDEVSPSQNERPTQLTQTQLTARAFVQRPSFSDLKGSEDEQSEDVQHRDEGAVNSDAVGVGMPDSYDSDTFEWTQRPCSPELSSSPLNWKELNSQKSYNDQSAQQILASVVGKNHNILMQEVDEAARSPPRSMQSPGVVEATQTPQLHQEPVRIMKGTLEKCSRLKKLDRSKSSSKACRRLRPNDPPLPVSTGGRNGASLSKSVSTKRESAKKQRKSRKLASADSSKETQAGAVKANKSHDLLLNETPKRITRNIPLRRCNRQEDVPELHHVDISRDEERMDDGNLGHDLVNNCPCVFCGLAGDCEVSGQMVKYKDGFLYHKAIIIKVVHVHKLCAEWAPDVYFVDGEPKNLACEITRGQKIKCSCCQKRGAALGCCKKRCKRSFHYRCARATLGCKWDEDDFVMFCPEHANCTFPKRKRSRKTPSKDGLASAVGLNIELSNKNATPKVQRWLTSPACKWVLCGSGLDRQLKIQLASFASITGASLVKAWSPTVTHVITGTDEQGNAKRTLKFLMAMLEGKWIVKVEWILQCMSAGHMVSEEQYQVNSDGSDCVDGPKRSHALAAAKAPKLLEGLSFYLCGDFTVSKEDLHLLIVTGKGVVLHRKPLPLDPSSCSEGAHANIPQRGQTIVLHNGEVDEKGKNNTQLHEAKSVAVSAGAHVAPVSWLLDSIAAYKLLPTQERNQE